MLRKALYTVFTCILALVSMSQTVFAQQRRPENQPKYDLQPYHFGFTLGMNNMFFAVKLLSTNLEQDTVYVVESEPEMGFDIGIVSNLRLGEYADLRFIPTLSFGERVMIFTRKINDTVFFDTKKKVESTYIEFPFQLKLKAKRQQNARAYVLAGFKYCLDLASQAKKKEQDDEIRVKLKKNDFAFEVGVGYDFYTTYPKIGVELKMAYGLRDMVKHEDNVFINRIDNLKSKIFYLTITFE